MHVYIDLYHAVDKVLTYSYIYSYHIQPASNGL